MLSPITLRQAHAAAAVAHLAQGVVLSVLIARITEGAYEWPVTFVGWERVISSATLRFHIGVLVPVFSFLSAVNHAFVVLRPGWYETVLARRTNSLRWFEYSASAGLMVVLIAILCGVNELRTIVALGLQNCALQMMGLLIERQKARSPSASANSRRVNDTSEQQRLTGANTQPPPPDRAQLLGWLFVAWLIFLAMWEQLVFSFFTVLIESAVNPPDAVWSIIFVELGLFASFGVVQTLYVLDKMGFVAYEMAFVGLSLAAKTLLAWLVFGGVLSADSRFPGETTPP